MRIVNCRVCNIDLDDDDDDLHFVLCEECKNVALCNDCSKEDKNYYKYFSTYPYLILCVECS
jgi:hypothetical protein